MTAKRPTKKRARKRGKPVPQKRVAAQTDLATVEVPIEDEATRLKLEVLQLKLDNKRKEVTDEVVKEYQAKVDGAIARKLRNDPTFPKLNDEFQRLLNDTAKALSPGEAYTPVNLNTGSGVFTYAVAEDAS